MGDKVCGIDTVQITDTVNLFQEFPELGQFRFKAAADWIDAGRSRITISRNYGLTPDEEKSTKNFELESEEPPILIGVPVSDKPRACPVELVLSALASCLTMGITFNAAVRNIHIHALHIDVQGDIDFRGYLGIPVERLGYHHIDIHCQVESSATDEELQELIQYVQKTSPLLDIIGNTLHDISLRVTSLQDDARRAP
ncbi:MAG: OsmC family protein [Magnetococcales bacterium]|nr:OsmC family protein [Magnetococcales bacterium]